MAIPQPPRSVEFSGSESMTSVNNDNVDAKAEEVINALTCKLINIYTQKRRWIYPSYRFPKSSFNVWRSLLALLIENEIDLESYINYAFQKYYPYPNVKDLLNKTCLTDYKNNIDTSTLADKAKNEISYMMNVIVVHVKNGRSIREVLEDPALPILNCVRYVAYVQLPEYDKLKCKEFEEKAKLELLTRPYHLNILQPYLNWNSNV